MRRLRHAPVSRTLVALVAHAWMALTCAIHFSGSAHAQDHETHAITSLIGATWDKPDSKVETDPVVISGQFAVASWTQGDRGGRALLRKEDERWKVVLCSGDPLKSASGLVEAGVPAPDANKIAEDLSAAEARAPAERRAKFSLFEGTVFGDADTHHPDAHHQHNH
ncbi:copper uptake system-associated protein [Hyphomicrobium sp.]|uniref:copper uptake system-associated protein n=1 Tax=Hyphomicrobium sp. TaxID=82 RepID=UPI002E2FF290|nr:copper uptake system-associated protein [Hyphomicrobium sp.]HEX2841145.1 copper uptake system-associated protein [Hyphomicrobium sp.]